MGVGFRVQVHPMIMILLRALFWEKQCKIFAINDASG